MSKPTPYVVTFVNGRRMTTRQGSRMQALACARDLSRLQRSPVRSVVAL